MVKSLLRSSIPRFFDLFQAAGRHRVNFSNDPTVVFKDLFRLIIYHPVVDFVSPIWVPEGLRVIDVDIVSGSLNPISIGYIIHRYGSAFICSVIAIALMAADVLLDIFPSPVIRETKIP
jgi:hypothetical protein